MSVHQEQFFKTTRPDSMTSFSEIDLRDVGIRRTKLVLALLDIIESMDGTIHFTDWVQRTSKKIGHCDRASFYRAVHRLTSKGLVHEIEPRIYLAALSRSLKEPKVVTSCIGCHRDFRDSASREFQEILNYLPETTPLSKIKMVSLKGYCEDCDDETH